MVAVIQPERPPRLRALIVDDSRIARHVLGGLLDRLGYEVEAADSAEAGFEKVAAEKPDIVFMDHLLPGMQGLAAVRRLREDPETAHLPIVMYTSQESEAFASVARAAGADDIFVKTADPGDLGKILERLAKTAGAGKPRASAEVLSLRGAYTRPAHTDTSDRGLEALLDGHREKIRQDLLSEFAIMERYEERMRRSLFRRVDDVSRQTIAAVNRALLEQQRMQDDATRSRRRSLFTVSAFAAALLIGFVLGLKV